MAQANEEVSVNEETIVDDAFENVGSIEVSQPVINPMIQKQAELEEHYKITCTQEVLLMEQLKKAQERRQALAGQLDLIRSLVA
jgi:hypothetical protein